MVGKRYKSLNNLKRKHKRRRLAQDRKCTNYFRSVTQITPNDYNVPNRNSNNSENLLDSYHRAEDCDHSSTENKDYFIRIVDSSVSATNVSADHEDTLYEDSETPSLRNKEKK